MANGHSEEFKHDAVRIALTSGLTRFQIASDLRMGVSTRNKWIKVPQDTKRPPAGAGRISDVLFQVLKYDVFCDGAVGG